MGEENNHLLRVTGGVGDNHCDSYDGWWRCSSRRVTGDTLCHHHRYLRNISTTKIIRQSKKKNTKLALVSTIIARSSPSIQYPSPPPPPTVIRTVEIGQMWAVRHSIDGLPRAYARVDRILHPLFAVAEVTFLEPYPLSYNESLWAEAKLPISCGTYRLLSSTSIKPLSCLTHLVIAEVVHSEHCDFQIFKVYPREGEIWAVYRECKEESSSCHCPVFRLVEVVDDFRDDQEGLQVIGVELKLEADGKVRRRKWKCGYELMRRFSEFELPLFSHRVPVKMIDDDGRGDDRPVWRVDWSPSKYYL